MASKFKVDLRIEIRNLNYPRVHVHVASGGHFGGSEAMVALQMTSEVKADLKLNSVTSITYVPMLLWPVNANAHKCSALPTSSFSSNCARAIC